MPIFFRAKLFSDVEKGGFPTTFLSIHRAIPSIYGDPLWKSLFCFGVEQSEKLRSWGRLTSLSNEPSFRRSRADQAFLMGQSFRDFSPT